VSGPEVVADNWMGAAATVLVALIGYLSVRATARAGRRAGREQESIERGVVSTETLIDLVGTYENRLHDLDERVKRTETDLSKTKRDLDGMHDWKRAAIRYIRALRQHGLHHLPGEVLPEPPPELLVDLAD